MKKDRAIECNCHVLFVGISFKQLAQQILPLASYYSMTVRFVEDKVLPDDGQVNHALRGALSCLLKDYLVRYSSRKLAMQYFVFHSSTINSIVAVVCGTIGDRTHSREAESTKTLVLHSTDDGDDVYIESNYVDHLQGMIYLCKLRRRSEDYLICDFFHTRDEIQNCF